MSCVHMVGRQAPAGGTFSRLRQGENGARHGEGASQKAQVGRVVSETLAARSRCTGNVRILPVRLRG